MSYSELAYSEIWHSEVILYGTVVVDRLSDRNAQTQPKQRHPWTQKEAVLSRRRTRKTARQERTTSSGLYILRYTFFVFLRAGPHEHARMRQHQRPIKHVQDRAVPVQNQALNEHIFSR